MFAYDKHNPTTAKVITLQWVGHLLSSCSIKCSLDQKMFENNVAKLDPISVLQYHSKIFLSDKPFLQKLKVLFQLQVK